MAVPALNFDLVEDKSGRVRRDKGLPFDQMLLPDIFHAQFPVAHLVLEAWGIVFNGQQGLEQESVPMTSNILLPN